MVKIGRQKWRNTIFSVLAMFFVAGIICASSASAVNAIFKTTNAIVADKSAGVSADIISVDDAVINTSVTFKNVGDTVSYKITIKNTDKVDHLIDSITDNNQNSTISYSYDKHKNFKIKAGKSFDLNVVAKYQTATTKEAILSDVLFTISFDGGKSRIGLNPQTGDDINHYVAIAAISGVGLLCLAVRAKNKKLASKILAVAIIGAIALAPAAANAAKLATNNFSLKTIYYFGVTTQPSINISVSDADVWKPKKTITINYTVGGDVANQYSIDGGRTWNMYTAPFEIAKNNTEILARTIDTNNNVILDATETARKIDPVVPTVSISLGGKYYSGQALDLSTVTTYTAGESGATVRWYAGDVELTNLSDTYLIDRMEEQYEIEVKAVVTSGAGLSAEDYSETLIIKYARWDGFFIGPLTRDNIGNIKFVSWAEMPGSESEWTDISVGQDGAVMEYYVLNSETNLYDIYIASPYGYSRYKDDSMGSNFLPSTDANINHTTSASQGGVNSCQDHYGMFAYMPNLKTIDFKYLDMFNINDMSCMFNNIDFNTTYWDATSALTTITWGEKFNTVNVTNMSFAFAGLVNLQSLDLSSFDTSSAISLKGLFAKNETLQSLELANWDTSKVRDFGYVFYSTPNLKNYDITNWNTSSAVTLNGTFYGAGVETLDLSKWDVSNVKTFYQLFENASELKSVNMTGWNTSNVIDMSYMFNRAGVISLDLRSFDTSNVQRMGDMFSSTKSLTSVNVSTFDTSNVWDMEGMFWGSSIKVLDLDNFNTKKVETFYYFAASSAIETINFRHLDFSSAETLYLMFYNANKLKNVFVEAIPQTNSGTNTSYMWYAAGVNHFTTKTYDD